MKIISAIFASLLLAQVYGNGIPVVFEGEEVADLTIEECFDVVECIGEKIVDAEFNPEEDGQGIIETVQTLVNLIQGYLNCQAILSDPPSRAEQLQHTICMTAWRAQALVTAIRLQQTITDASETVRATWVVVQDTCSEGRPILPCINHLIEDPDTEEAVPY